MCLFRFLKPFSRNGQLGAPSEIIRGDGKIKDIICFLFSVGSKGRRRFAAELKISRCFLFPMYVAVATTSGGEDWQWEGWSP